MFYLKRLKPELSQDAAGCVGNDAFGAEAEKQFPDFAAGRSPALH
jgi:hypothetical protein